MPYANALHLKQYPFVRLVACLIAGILLQWFLQFSLMVLAACFCFIAVVLLVFIFIPFALAFNWHWLRGIAILLLFVLAGCMVTYTKDIRHNNQWVGNNYHAGQQVLVTIQEPLVEKPKSWKALATVTAIQQGSGWRKVTGDVLLYFYKGKLKPKLHYGSQIVVRANLEPIKNSGNPGAFDYKQYSLFHGVGYQAFIYPGQYANTWIDNGNSLQQALYNARDFTIASIQQTIPGEKEQGVAEALLIGYRDKLDPDLVQAYTNTGVVHIIAISGLHLAMIYGLLVTIFGLFPSNRATRLVKAVVILTVLWVFSLLAGAVPSITRAAVMFSFLALGEGLGKRTNTYNTLAASAFCLLVYNPFYLWDAGFMLSYGAVISIVAFYRPVYNWFYVKNKLLNAVWAATAVTISAQIITFPIILFYFHQFANLFLVANFIAVPLSGIILYGELALLCLLFIPFIAKWLGIVVGLLIHFLDSFIENINRMPFAVWNNIQADVLQTLLLYGFMLALCAWLLFKKPKVLLVSLSFITVFFIYSGIKAIGINRQQKLIVYNIPHQTAIDIIQGSGYHFIGDSILLQPGPLVRYNLQPSRLLNGVSLSSQPSPAANTANTCVSVNHTKILLLNDTFAINQTAGKIPVDIIILSKNPKYSIYALQSAFQFKKLVFDSSNPMWKIRRWKKDCDSLHLRFHSVPDQGAFEMNL